MERNRLTSKTRTLLLDEVLWNRDTDVIRKLLLYGEEVNARDGSKYRNIDLIRKLLGSDEDVNARDNYGRTLLHIAAKNLPRDTVNELFPITKNPKLQDLLVGLHLSARNSDFSKILKIMETRVRRGASVVELLLHHGADVYARNNLERTPLHAAAINHDVHDLLRYLHKYWPESRSEEASLKSLLQAVTNAAVHTIRLLLLNGAELNVEDANGTSPLHYAAVACLPGVVKSLLEHGMAVNAADKFGQTPLHVAAEKGRFVGEQTMLDNGRDERHWRLSPLYLALCNDALDSVEALLEHGANANALDSYGKTPLHIAVQRGWSDMVKLCLEHGADPNIKNDLGETALHRALRLEVKHEVKKLACLLLEHGANLKITSRNGLTPAQVMCLCLGCLGDEEITFFAKPQLLDVMTAFFSHGEDFNHRVVGDTPYDIIIRSKFHSDSIKIVAETHMRRLIALGAIHMVEKNRPLISGAMDYAYEMHTSYTRHRVLEHYRYYYNKCTAEVDKLKTVRISQNITLADVLTLGSPTRVANILGSVNFKKYAKTRFLKRKYPIYLFLIKFQHQRGLEMKILCEKCEASLGILLSGKLDRDCVYEILQYLSEIDLNNLNKAVENVLTR